MNKILENLIKSVVPGKATVVQGVYGSGKIEHCIQAIKYFGREPFLINLDVLQPFDFYNNLYNNNLSNLLKGIDNRYGIIFSGIDKCLAYNVGVFSLSILEYFMDHNDPLAFFTVNDIKNISLSSFVLERVVANYIEL